MGTEEYVVVLTTFPTDRDIDPFAKALVEERLAACVNVLPPMVSFYSWKGALERSEERQLLIKTTRVRVADLEARLRTLHPFEVPEFIVLPMISGSPSYLSWISEAVK